MVGQKNHGFVQFPLPTNGGILSSSYTAVTDLPYSTPGETMPVPLETTLSFATAPAQQPFPGSLGGTTTETPKDPTNGDFVDCYVDFSEYYKAIEIYGEDYVINSVQL